MIKIILFIFYIIAFTFGFFILSLVFNYNPFDVQLENKASLLSAIGIIISAYIASLSVLLSIENTKNIEITKQKKELNEELNILKSKTSILKNFLSYYFRDDSHYKKSLSESSISEQCIHHKDMSNELVEKLNNYEEFVDAKVKTILNDNEILEILQKIIKNISIVRGEEIFKKEAVKKGFTITVHLEKTLIEDLKNLEGKLEKCLL